MESTVSAVKADPIGHTLEGALHGLLPFSLWPDAKRKDVEERVVYTGSSSDMAA